MRKSKTQTIINAMMILANDIQSGDGVANQACREAAERLGELSTGKEGWLLGYDPHQERWVIYAEDPQNVLCCEFPAAYELIAELGPDERDRLNGEKILGKS